MPTPDSSTVGTNNAEGSSVTTGFISDDAFQDAGQYRQDHELSDRADKEGDIRQTTTRQHAKRVVCLLTTGVSIS